MSPKRMKWADLCLKAHLVYWVISNGSVPNFKNAIILLDQDSHAFGQINQMSLPYFVLVWVTIALEIF